jgi:hypothetical protein
MKGTTVDQEIREALDRVHNRIDDINTTIANRFEAASVERTLLTAATQRLLERIGANGRLVTTDDCHAVREACAALRKLDAREAAEPRQWLSRLIIGLLAGALIAQGVSAAISHFSDKGGTHETHGNTAVGKH